VNRWTGFHASPPDTFWRVASLALPPDQLPELGSSLCWVVYLPLPLNPDGIDGFKAIAVQICVVVERDDCVDNALHS
jgi:hypothetical protein